MPLTIPRRRTEKVSRSSRHRTTHDVRFLETARQLAGMEIAYVGHPEFSRRTAEKWLERQRPVETATEPDEPREAVGVAFVSGLVTARLLKPAEERYLFLRMNYLRYRAERARRRIDPDRPGREIVAEVEQLLAESIRLRNQIAEANVRLLVAVAKKLSQSVDQMSDLIGEGMLPLLRAVELFDVHRGFRFSTYATWAVRNQMLRMLRRQRTSVAMLRAEQDIGWDQVAARPTVVDEAAIVASPAALIAELSARLSDRERDIIERRFGLNGQPSGQSLAEIAQQLGLSKERVRQLVIVALAKMRSAAQAEAFNDESAGGRLPGWD